MANGNNQSIVRLQDGRVVCLSYGVPVAAFIPARGYLRSAARYSVTTSRHMNGFAGKDAPEVPESELLALIAPIGRQ